MFRLSVGIESPDDLIADLARVRDLKLILRHRRLYAAGTTACSPGNQRQVGNGDDRQEFPRIGNQHDGRE